MRLQQLLSRVRQIWSGRPDQAAAVRSPTPTRNPMSRSPKVSLRAAAERRVVLGGLLMGIMIAIGIAAPQPARTGTSSSAAWLASISPLGYDKAIYDSGAALGRDEAVVPLSGATNAPDGAVIEARAVRFDDTSDVPTGAATPWAVIGTASSGEASV